MNFIYRHIVLIGRVTAILLLLSSLGFTAVLEMCCEPGGVGSQLMADTHSATAECGIPVHPTVMPVGNECHTKVLAGGLNNTPAVFTKDSNLNNNKPDRLLSLISHVAPHLPSDLATRQSLPILSEKPSPPPLEKYVLNETFLI